MFAVVIPAYNAAETLPELFDLLLNLVEPRQVILVDDGSVDATAEVASRARVNVSKHHHNLGKGKALQTGFNEFLRSDYEFVVTMDADLQHRPSDLPSFMNTQTESGADIVVGKRPRLGSSMPLHRMLSNTLTSSLVSMRTGKRMVDSQCGYRLIRREVLKQITLENNGYEAETEFIIKAARKGFRIEFVPIQTVYGNEKSFMTNWKTTTQFVKVLLKEY